MFEMIGGYEMNFKPAYIEKIRAELEKRISDDEMKLALNCHSGAAFIKLDAKNGKKIVVAREARWVSDKKTYKFRAEIYDDTTGSLDKVYGADAFDKDALMRDVAIEVAKMCA